GFFGYELKQDFSFNSVMVVLFIGIFSTGLSVFSGSMGQHVGGGDYSRFASEPRSRIGDVDHVHPR
ncbi:MAG: hypothetical protein VX367_03875, partial [SAR324 cluster bacterium]|nr:hypothetical protein [SAR324 cluster bacterium]